MSVTKDTIIQAMVYETGIPASITSNFLDDVLKLIIDNTATDGVSKISKFGSFYLRIKKERMGRNLNNNQQMVISSRKIVSFIASSNLKKLINLTDSKQES
jgi:integration host factor subunit alpha